MSETTTQQAPVTEAQLAQAQTQYAEAETWLRAHGGGGHPETVGWVDKKIAAHAVIRRAAEASRSSPPPTMTPAERVEKIKARRETTAAMLAEPGGSALGEALREVAIAQSAELHAGDRRPGTYSDGDLRGVTRDAGLTDEGHALYVAALDRLGVPAGAERMQLAFALRESVPEDEGTLTEEAMARRVAEWWGDGADADAKLAAADRAWSALTRAERLAVNARRGSRPFMEAMARLGQKLPRR